MDTLLPQASWRVSRSVRLPDRPCADGLLEEGTDAIPVRLVIEQDGFVTGWDEGALGFEEDVLWFSGRVSSFRVAAMHILPGAFHLSRHEAVTDGEALRQGFPLRHAERSVWVHIQVLAHGKRAIALDEARLISEVKRLRALSGKRRKKPVSAPYAPTGTLFSFSARTSG